MPVPQDISAAIGKLAIPELLSLTYLERVGEHEWLVSELPLDDEAVQFVNLRRR
jgi:hypothetical protein